MPMYCVKNGKTFVMVQDTKKATKYGLEWVYISERKWKRMSEEEKKRYVP